MDCPVCGERLKEIERSGVMVDVCPTCKGIWLDRGEIDKLLEVEGGGSRVAPLARERDQRPVQDRHDDHDHDHDHDRGYRDDDRRRESEPGKKQKRTSLLGDILGGFGGD